MRRLTPDGTCSALAVLLLLLGAACGREDGATDPGADAWSDARDVRDGHGGATMADQEALAARVLAHIETGSALSAPAWRSDVDALAEVLWPGVLEGTSPLALSTHVQVLTIVADLAKRLAVEGQDGRALLAGGAALDLAIHDAGRAALAAGAVAWRTWVEGSASNLLAQKQAWLAGQIRAR